MGARVLKVEQGKDGTLDTKLFDARAEKQGDLSLYILVRLFAAAVSTVFVVGVGIFTLINGFVKRYDVRVLSVELVWGTVSDVLPLLLAVQQSGIKHMKSTLTYCVNLVQPHGVGYLLRCCFIPTEVPETYYQ